jgi:iron(III) transport system ATP-binding protein
MSALSLQGIGKSYGDLVALDAIDLDVETGSRLAIVGPSASGKTTLLRIIAGFETPDIGRVILDNAVLADGYDAMPAHRRGIGFVAQDGALFPHLTVGANVGFGLALKGVERDSRIAELLATVGLEASLAGRRPDQLSGGQQQRVAIARALAQQPKLMLLDEPFSALDAGLRAATRKAVAEVLTKAGITTILVTHDQAEALSFADQVVVLQHGKLAQLGAPRDLYLRPRTTAVATYLGDSVMLTADIADGFATCQLGRIPANSGSWRGRAQIMLRPEQVQLAEVAEAPTNAHIIDHCYGQIVAAAFAGGTSELAIRLLPLVHSSDETPLIVRNSGHHLPAVGACVRLTVDGAAHVFVDDPEGQ